MPSPKRQGCEQVPLAVEQQGNCLESSPQRVLQIFPQGSTGGTEKMNLQRVLGNFWELLRKISPEPKQGSLAKSTHQQFSIPKAHRGYPMCDKRDCAIQGCVVGLNDLPQSLPALFALTFHWWKSPTQVSWGSLFLARFGPQDSRDWHCVPKPSFSFSF